MAVHNTLIAARNLYVARGAMPVLRDVSLAVSAGEALAICGGNGSGKSTLIQALLGLIPHQQGTVELFGTPVAKFREWRRVGYVPQHASLNVQHATVKEVVESGRLAHVRPFQRFRASDKNAVGEALERVDLADRARWPFHSLSGGQKQRTLIARALTTEPDLLVMDEPFAGVDIHSQQGVAALLDSLRNDGLGMTVVLHELGAMQDRLDHSITLCDGRVVPDEASGNHHHHGQTRSRSLTGLTDPVAGSHA